MRAKGENSEDRYAVRDDIFGGGVGVYECKNGIQV